MALVLEMPAGELDTSPPFDADPIATATAKTAADLLERGEAEGEIVNGEIDTPPVEIQGDTQSEPKTVNNEIDATANGKPKRKRKPKGGKGIELFADPAPTGDQIKSPSPELSARMGDIKTSPATRKFQIAKVTAEYVETSLEINNLQDEIEQAKSRLKNLIELQSHQAIELRHLRNDDQWQPELPLADPSTNPSTNPQSPSAAAAITAEASDDARPTSELPPKGDAPPAVAANGDDVSQDAWRTVSIDDLSLPFSITAKLIEDSISTLGQLEDLRGEISQRRQKWPKGIGLAKITLIEDAVVKWLTKNRDREAFAGVSQSAVTQDAANAEVTVKHPAQSHDAPPAAVFQGEWEDLTADQQQSFIIARAGEINDGTPSCLDRKHPSGDSFWATGYRDGENNENLFDCIYVPGIEQDDWIRGYLAAKAVEDYPTAKGNETSSPQLPPATSSLGDDIDDI